MKGKRSSKAKRLSKAKRVSKDMISSLPSTIIETILCLIPIKDAVRTSTLSKKWRYVWTYIPKLVFDEKDMFDKKDTSADDTNMFDESADETLVPEAEKRPTKRERLTGKCKVFYAIHQVLLLHQAPILEFTLAMYADRTCYEIDQIITYLSRNNTLKKFTLNLSCNYCYRPFLLPSSVFSLHQLTDLDLSDSVLDFESTVSGFGSLTSLSLNDVNFTQITLLHLLSSSPLLKSILEWENVIGYNYLDYTIIMLLECLSSVQHLTICIGIVEFFVHDVFPRELPTTLVHLKYFCLCEMTFAFGYETPFLFLLIRSAPNLEKIKLQIIRIDDVDSISMENYSDIWLEHLRELEIKDLSDSKNELEFVKLILAKSPVLKKVNIFLDREVTYDDEMVLLTTLLRSPRQSHMLEISVER